jgi:hypothetical protein
MTAPAFLDVLEDLITDALEDVIGRAPCGLALFG